MRSEEILSAPLTVNWSLSYSCNFTCQHCYSRLETESGLSTDEVKQVVDLLSSKGVVFINLGGGEPLIYPELHEVASYAVSKKLNVTMNSNGWLLDRKAAKEIAKTGFYSVGISIDSADSTTHDNFRNKAGSFNRALSALDNLREEGVSTTISCVISRNNLHDWEGMVDVAREHGARILYLHNYKCTGMGKVNMEDLDLTPQQWGEFYTHALEVQKELKDITISFDDPIMASLPGYKPDTAVSGSTCGKLSLHIGPDADITPCGFIPLSIGNILKDDFDEIWFSSPVLQKMRSKTPQGKCKGCGIYDDCLGGCTARVYAMTGTFDQPDPHCWVEDEDPEALTDE